MSGDANSERPQRVKIACRGVTKAFGEARVFFGRAPLAAEVVLEEVALAASGLSFGVVTAADFAPDGSEILLRTTATAMLFPRRPGESVARALTRPPCDVPLHLEEQGEAIAFVGDGSGYFTVSEGRAPPLWRFDRVAPRLVQR